MKFTIVLKCPVVGGMIQTKPLIFSPTEESAFQKNPCAHYKNL